MKITPEQREAWLANTSRSSFNVWLDARVKQADGKLDLNKPYEVAERYGITKRYDHLNVGQQQMTLGLALSARIPKELYETAERLT